MTTPWPGVRRCSAFVINRADASAAMIRTNRHARCRPWLVLTAFAGVATVSLLLALITGSVHVPVSAVLEAFVGRSHGAAATLVYDLRLPRAIAGFACGGLLALAGAVLQVLLRNPLADPYVLGISGGAGVGALAAMLLGATGGLIGGAAFVGALAVMLLVFALARGDGAWTQARLLLTGVVVSAGCGAVVALILSVAPDNRLHGMLFWLMGDLAQAGDGLTASVVLLILLWVALYFARDLNVLARGAEQARTLGVPVDRVRRVVYFVASLATATSVTQAGAIGFVGLIVPHLVRLIVGNDQRLLLPSAVLAGGSLLVIADTLARTVVAPQQLPVGVLTALIGVPVFLFLLLRETRPGY